MREIAIGQENGKVVLGFDENTKDRMCKKNTTTILENVSDELFYELSTQPRNKVLELLETI